VAPSAMGSKAGWLPVALLLAAMALSSVLPPPSVAAAADSGEADHAVQQHSERISGPNLSPNSFLHIVFFLKVNVVVKDLGLRRSCCSR
jgi:hypothetical protein